MKTILKTIAIFIIAFFITIILAYTLGNEVESYSDEQAYQSYIIDSDIGVNGENVCYTNYYYNANNYRLKVPCTRQQFIRLEHQARAGQLRENSYNYKLVNLNSFLIKGGFEPLYY